MVGLVVYLMFLVASLFVLYFVIRKGVHHGILDAWAARGSAELERTWPAVDDSAPR